jgi:AAA-like domain
MKKIFNIAGPCHPDKHYMLPAQERCRDLIQLIDEEQYFVIHAARQSGKTTLLLELTRQLNDTGNYYALYCSLETVQGMVETNDGIPAILGVLRTQVKFHQQLRKYSFATQAKEADVNTVLREALTYFCESLDRPLVIFFDEIDCLSNGTLISFLRQLRDGYVNRNQIPFVQSIALVGMRNIRDYKGKLREEQKTLGSASPFNIVSDSLTLRNFNAAEIAKLYAQHTEITGQVFSPAVIETVSDNTQGQPWLVNAIAREIVVNRLNYDFSQPIHLEYVNQAIQTIIKRRDTHIDSLMERLKEARVQRILEPVILGESKRYDLLDDDYQYVLDLGLLRIVNNQMVPANPIYGEEIIRTLSFRSQQELEDISSLPNIPAYLQDGQLDMKQLLSDFQQFWRNNSDIWVDKYQYREAAPHLILQAFLQQVIDTKGQVSRELASGTRRLDLCIHYQGHLYPIELKLHYGDKTYPEGQQQLADYLDKLGCVEGWLIVFDRRLRVSWKKKIFWRTQSHAGKTIHVVGC